MKNFNSLVGLSPELRAVLADVGSGGLPVIRGSWKIVDPYKVSAAAVGANNDTWFTTAAASAAGTGTLGASIA